MPDDHGQHERRFLQREGRPDAFAGPSPERQVGEAVDRRRGAAEKTSGIERVGTIPQQPVPVEHVGRDDDQRSRPHRFAVQRVVTKSDAADRRYRADTGGWFPRSPRGFRSGDRRCRRSPTLGASAVHLGFYYLLIITYYYNF